MLNYQLILSDILKRWQCVHLFEFTHNDRIVYLNFPYFELEFIYNIWLQCIVLKIVIQCEKYIMLQMSSSED